MSSLSSPTLLPSAPSPQGARHQERQDAQGVPRPLLVCQRRGVQLRRHPGGRGEGLTGPNRQALATCMCRKLAWAGRAIQETVRPPLGHPSCVLTVALPSTPPACQVISAGADATVRVWDAKTCDCTFVFRPPQASATAEAPVVSVALNPQVCCGCGGEGGEGVAAWLADAACRPTAGSWQLALQQNCRGLHSGCLHP